MHAMVWIVSLPNSYVGVLTSSVTVFGYRTFMKVIKFKWGPKGGALIDQRFWSSKLCNGFDNRVRLNFQRGPYLDPALDSFCLFLFLNPNVYRTLFCSNKNHKSILNVTSNMCKFSLKVLWPFSLLGQESVHMHACLILLSLWHNRWTRSWSLIYEEKFSHGKDSLAWGDGVYATWTPSMARMCHILVGGFLDI